MMRYLLTPVAIVLGLAMVAIMAICVHAVADTAPPGDAAPASDARPSRWPMNTTSAEGANVTIFQPQLEDACDRGVAEPDRFTAGSSVGDVD